MRLNTDAKIKLLHMAGAPWNFLDPTAKISDKQVEIIGRPERIKLVNAGAGYGKSVTAAMEALCELVIPHSRTAIVAATYDLCEPEFKYVHDAFLRLFDTNATSRLINVNTKRSHDMEIDTIWDSRLQVFSTEKGDGDAVLGKEFDLAILAEGSKISANAYRRKIFPRTVRRAKKQRETGYTRETGRIVIYSTPDHFDGATAVVYEKVLKETNGKPKLFEYPNKPWAESIWCKEAPSSENPSFDTSQFEAARKMMTPEEFDEQMMGKFTRKSGLIFKEFNKDFHVRQMPSEKELAKMKFGVGIDTGKGFAAILLGIDADRKKWVLGEVYNNACTSEENYRDVENMVSEVLGPLCPANSFEEVKKRIAVWAIDLRSQDKDNAEELLGVGVDWIDDNWEPSVNMFRTWFGAKELFIVEDCVWLIEELDHYSWKRSLRGQSTNSTLVEATDSTGADHAIDAMRFGGTLLDNDGPLEEAEVSISFEDAYWKNEFHKRTGRLMERMQEPSSPMDAFRRTHEL